MPTIPRRSMSSTASKASSVFPSFQRVLTITTCIKENLIQQKFLAACQPSTCFCITFIGQSIGNTWLLHFLEKVMNQIVFATFEHNLNEHFSLATSIIKHISITNMFQASTKACIEGSHTPHQPKSILKKGSKRRNSPFTTIEEMSKGGQSARLLCYKILSPFLFSPLLKYAICSRFFILLSFIA